jgi:hypothetical protein
MNGNPSWNILMMLLLSVSLTTPSCLTNEEVVEEEEKVLRCVGDAIECGEEYIALVCYNPNSVWHLSECPEEGRVCRLRSTGDAYCLALTERMCLAPPDIQSEFVRRACGIYGR